MHKYCIFWRICLIKFVGMYSLNYDNMNKLFDFNLIDMQIKNRDMVEFDLTISSDQLIGAYDNLYK